MISAASRPARTLCGASLPPHGGSTVTRAPILPAGDAVSLSRPHNIPRRLYQRARRRAAAREERSFQTGLRTDPEAPALILSPHWDDAVLDCWDVLVSQLDLNVVNVFAGVRLRPCDRYKRLAALPQRWFLSRAVECRLCSSLVK